MPSIIEGYNYDIFISYRQKDNKHDGWVTKFVENLKGELEATFKEDVSVYFDENPHDRLQETYDVDKSLEGKLKCLIFIPILSQTYCDPNSYAWQHEFLAFLQMVKNDSFGKDVKLRGGNVASRILPVRIHDLEPEDIKLYEKETNSVLRAVDFVFRTSSGISRPLLSNEDHPNDNLNKTYYRDQISKAVHTVKEIVIGMKAEPAMVAEDKVQVRDSFKEVKEEIKELKEKPAKAVSRRILYTVSAVAILVIAAILTYPKIFKKDTLERLRASGGRISVAVMPFQNMTNDTTKNFWQEMIQDNLITFLSNSEELKVRQTESIISLLQNNNITNYATITPSIASKVSQKLDANVFVHGSINQIGDMIRLNAKLIDSKSEMVFKSFQIDGSEKNIFQLIDSLSVKLKDFLLISKLKNEVTPDFQHFVSTNSPDAYRSFIYGNKVFFNKMDFLSSIDYYLDAVKKDTNFIYATIMLSLSYLNAGLYDEGKTWCMEVYKKRDKMPVRLKIYTNRLYARYFETPYIAIDYLRELQQIDDQFPISFYEVGFYYTCLNQYDKAIPEFEKALEIYEKWDSKPAWISNYTWLGLAYHKTGQYNKEKKLYKKAERDFPNNPNLMYNQAIHSLVENDTVLANNYIKNYTSICKANSFTEAQILTNLAEIYSEANLLDKAEAYYRKAYSLESNDPERLNNLAMFIIDNDRNINEGLDLIHKAFGLKEDNPSYLHTKGWGLYKQGRFEEALNLLEKSWDLRPVYKSGLYPHIQEAKKAFEYQKNTK